MFNFKHFSKCAYVAISFSKTDQLRLSTTLILEKCTDEIICPVTALLHVRSLRHIRTRDYLISHFNHQCVSQYQIS